MIRRLRAALLRPVHDARDAAMALLGRDLAAGVVQHRGVLVVGLGFSPEAATVRSVVDFVYTTVLDRESIREGRITTALKRCVFVLAPGPVKANGTTYSLLAQRFPRIGVVVTRIQADGGWPERFAEALAGVVAANVFPQGAAQARSGLRAADRAALHDALPGFDMPGAA